MEWAREENLSIFKVTVIGRLSRAAGTPIKLCVFGTNPSVRLAWVFRSLAKVGFTPGGGRIRSLSSSRSRRRVALVFSSISFAPGGGGSANKVRALSSEYRFFPGQFSFDCGNELFCIKKTVDLGTFVLQQGSEAHATSFYILFLLQSMVICIKEFD